MGRLGSAVNEEQEIFKEGAMAMQAEIVTRLVAWGHLELAKRVFSLDLPKFSRYEKETISKPAEKVDPVMTLTQVLSKSMVEKIAGLQVMPDTQVVDILLMDPRTISHVTSNRYTSKASVSQLSEVLDDPLAIVIFLSDGNPVYLRVPPGLTNEAMNYIRQHVREISAELTKKLHGVDLNPPMTPEPMPKTLPDGVIDV
jgi:hypothetical protein